MLAHELSHVANRDVLIMTLASFFAMLAALLTRFGLYGGMFGGFGGGGRATNGNNGVPIWLIIFARLGRHLCDQLRPDPHDLALPRVRGRPRLGDHDRRAREPDERTPEDLERHHADPAAGPARGRRAMNAFFIIPTNWRTHISELFMDHPPLEKRLAALAEIAREMGKPVLNLPQIGASNSPNHLRQVGLDGQLLLELRLQLELARVVALLLLAGRDERPERAGLEAVDPVDRMAAARRSGRRRRGAGRRSRAPRTRWRARGPPSTWSSSSRVVDDRPTRSRTCRSSARASSRTTRRRSRAAPRRPCRPGELAGRERLEDDGADAGRLEPALDVERTAAVVSAKSRSRAGAFSFLRPKRDSVLADGPAPSPACAGRRSPSGLARADLRLELRELVVDLARRGDLRELAVELRAVVGDVLERARRGQLLDRRRARLQLLGLVPRALDRHAGVLHAAADARSRPRRS